jgi:lipoprotein-anchoring transpeptidase ErfK/SrfK
VVTRILRLRGLEKGYNNGIDPISGFCCDTYKRCIYIHGTPFEHLLGYPDGQGCVRLSNKDIIELYEHTPVGTRVFIAEKDDIADDLPTSKVATAMKSIH